MFYTAHDKAFQAFKREEGEKSVLGEFVNDLSLCNSKRSRGMFGMLLKPFITKQTGEINSFLLHCFGSISVHMEAL